MPGLLINGLELNKLHLTHKQNGRVLDKTLWKEKRESARQAAMSTNRRQGAEPGGAAAGQGCQQASGVRAVPRCAPHLGLKVLEDA